MTRCCSLVFLNLLLLFGGSMSVAQKLPRRMPEAKQNSLAMKGSVRLITIAPGHFHASLVQKVMYPQVAPEVWVYAPAGADLDEHLKRVEAYNTRTENPTTWQETLYTGTDFLARMLSEKTGNVVVIAGNNREKTKYIERSVKAGL